MSSVAGATILKRAAARSSDECEPPHAMEAPRYDLAPEDSGDDLDVPLEARHAERWRRADDSNHARASTAALAAEVRDDSFRYESHECEYTVDYLNELLSVRKRSGKVSCYDGHYAWVIKFSKDT